jgi:CRP-like cAMP-binding protein
MINMYDSLINHIKEIVPLPEQDQVLIRNSFVEKPVKKNDFLLSRGDISNHMRFIVDGCMKVYYLDEDGNERIYQFGIEGWWVNDLYSYLTQTPSEYFIKAIQDTRLLMIHRDTLEKLFDKAPMIERFFRIKFQTAYVALQDRMVKTMSETAEERYIKFQANFRKMEQRIPQYMIAAYLGITPEHLSAIRKKMSTNTK